MATTAVTLNDLEGHSPVAGPIKCNSSNICAAFYTMSTDSVLAQFLCISRASCCKKLSAFWQRYKKIKGIVVYVSLCRPKQSTPHHDQSSLILANVKW